MKPSMAIIVWQRYLLDSSCMSETSLRSRWAHYGQRSCWHNVNGLPTMRASRLLMRKRGRSAAGRRLRNGSRCLAQLRLYQYALDSALDSDSFKLFPKPSEKRP